MPINKNIPLIQSRKNKITNSDEKYDQYLIITYDISIKVDVFLFGNLSLIILFNYI